MRKLNTETFLTKEPYCTILSTLRTGKRNAVKKRELVRITELDELVFRKAIETLRRARVCIISDAAGYYYPENRREIECYIRRVERTAKSHFYTLRAAKNALNEFEG